MHAGEGQVAAQNFVNGKPGVAWAAGLTITTSGLSKADRLLVQEAVESAGGRCAI